MRRTQTGSMGSISDGQAEEIAETYTPIERTHTQPDDACKGGLLALLLTRLGYSSKYA